MRFFGFSDISWDDVASEPPVDARRCEHAGCDKPGEYRAPKSRDDLSAHVWFCLEHVRAYNASWDFFAGMSQPEIEFYQRNTATWHRPTWRLGAKRREEADTGADSTAWRDDLGILREFTRARTPAPEPPRKPVRWHLAPERRALSELGLTVEATVAEVKIRYKELAKRFHPDANGGSKTAEDQLKDINQAYSYLMSRSRKSPRA